jgi:hypothetical protein
MRQPLETLMLLIPVQDSPQIHENMTRNVHFTAAVYVIREISPIPNIFHQKFWAQI